MCTHNDGNFVIQDYEENAKKKRNQQEFQLSCYTQISHKSISPSLSVPISYFEELFCICKV